MDGIEALFALCRRCIPDRKSTLTMILIVSFVALLDVINPLLIMNAVDVLVSATTSQTDIESRWRLILCYASAVLGIMALQYWWRRKYIILESKVTSSFSVALRRDLLEQAGERISRDSGSIQTGNLLSTFTNEGQSVQEYLMMLLGDVPFDLATVLGISLAMSLINWRLSLLVLGFFTLWLSVIALLGRKGWTNETDLAQSRASLATEVHELLAATRLVRTAGLEAAEKKRFEGFEDKHTAILETTSTSRAAIAPLHGLSEYAGILFVLVAGGYFVLHGSLTVGAIVACLAYMEMIAEPGARFATVIARTQSAAASALRINQLIKPTLPMNFGEVDEGPDIITSITFDEVSMSYPTASRAALSEISFRTKLGDVVAISGANGAGKTSLLNILLKLNDWSGGDILINETSLRVIKRKAWILKFGVMSQDIFLFNRTIAENIGIHGESRERVEGAARLVGLYDRIMQLPLGFDTPNGERGANLSGGERQRIALARLFLLDPPILVLDEPTAALDVETERELVPILRKLCSGKITFLISHRPKLLELATWELRLEQGRVVKFESKSAEINAMPNLKDSSLLALTSVLVS